MDSETEFPVPNWKESELIKEYFQTESEFVAVKLVLASFKNIVLRKHVVATVLKVSRSIASDAYIPYLAMNYFDRLYSSHPTILMDPFVEGRNDGERLRMIAIGCLTIAAKMRINNFSVDQILTAMKAMKVELTHQMVKKVEFLILDELNWKMMPVTAFCFLNHYYPYFKKFGGFKRRCINEIIVQAQGEHTFIDYKPSQIALSAFLAASKIAYPSEYDKIQNPSNFHKIDNEEEVDKCLNQMIKLCSILNIHIEPTESGMGSSCSKVVVVTRDETKEVGTSKVKEIQQGNSIAVVVDSCEEEEKEEGTVIFNGVGTSNVKEIQLGNGKATVVGSSEEKEKENETTIINGVGTPKVKEIQLGNSKAAVVCSSEEKEKHGTAIINWVETPKVKEIKLGNRKAAVVGSCEEKEKRKENGTVIINGVGTSKVKEIQQGNGKAAVVGSSEEKGKEDGTAIVNGVGTSKVEEVQHSKGKGVVVNLCEEEEDEEVGTVLIQRRQVMGNRDRSQVQVRMQVEVIQIPKDDKDRVEAIIRRSLEKRMAVEVEEPQLQMGRSSSEIVDLVEPMNFKVKWII